MSVISCYWLLVGRGQGASKYPPMHTTTQNYLAKMAVVPRNFTNHFDMFYPSQHLLHTLHKSFAFQLCFYLSWNNKAWYTENVAYFLRSSILKWVHKNSPILIRFFLMHADMTAVPIQSNDIVLNEVKDNLVLLEPPYRRN